LITRGFVDDTIITRGFSLEAVAPRKTRGGQSALWTDLSKVRFDDDNDMLEILANILPIILG
jgi:hypothetical protein